MATAVLKKKGSAKVEYISYDKKEDFRAIKLLSDGQIYVEHVTLCESLVDKKLAEYVKDDFELISGTVKFIEDIKK